MDAEDESTAILAKLESSTDLRHIHGLISVHLRPFKALKTQPPIRALAKQYLTFLNRSLSLIPSLLSKTPKPDPLSADSLFKSYALALDCLDIISPELNCKPYTACFQRGRLVRCYESWGRFLEGEREGFSVLWRMRGGEEREGRLVPRVGKGGKVDGDVAGLVAEVVATVVKCVCMKEGKTESDYRNVMVLVDEVAPWLSILDGSAREKYHRVLVTLMTKCTPLLLGELESSNKDLASVFLVATFAQYRKSSMHDQIHKYAARVCSSLFSLQDDQSLTIISCILRTVAIDCKVNVESSTIQFLELVSYCANKCRIATKNLCADLATHINNLAGDLNQVDLILRLYSSGLFLDSVTKGTHTSGPILGYLLDKDKVLNDLSGLLEISQTDILPTTNDGKNNYRFLLPFYNALKFTCQPLAEAIISARKELFSQVEYAFQPSILFTIRDALLQFCDVFLLCHSTLDQKSIEVDDYDRTMPGVAVAALTLSIRTNSCIKESVKVIKQAISADWIQTNALKFLFVCIYNIGVTLFRSDKMKEAAMTMKLCYRVAWKCVSRVSETFVDKPCKSSDDVSEEINFVNEACAKSAFLLDLLFNCKDHNKAKKVIKFSIEEWSAAATVFKTLPVPCDLVKQWVKIEYKLYKDPDTDGHGVSLYSLLSSSTSVSVKRHLGVILELERSSYNEMMVLNPKLSHKMQMDIIDVLLTKVYQKDDRLQRSKLLIIKGQELRISGFDRLDACIQCLSEAISLLIFKKNGVNDERVRQPHLAIAYSLRALCTQEAEPNSEIPSKDIEASLKIWLSTDFLADSHSERAYEDVLIILYHMIDMLSLKGCTKFHSDIYELIIRIFKKKKIPLAECMSLLWQCRRLSDALCPSPLNEASLLTLSKHCKESSQSMNWWKNCLSGSLPMEIGFWQRFFFMGTNILSEIKIDDVKQAASNLISSVPRSSDSAFLAGHLYYDLCERLISYGRLSEALSFAKEAHGLRSKVLREKFRYALDEQTKKKGESGETVKKSRYTFSYFQIHSSVATRAWPGDNSTLNFEDTVLTPWNVLQCYLESTLQVGIVHELMGDGLEAEFLLLWGKSISSLQGLCLFEVAFSTVLGRVYRKKQLWDQARDEFLSADNILENSFSCLKCRLLMKTTINLERGDLFLSKAGKQNKKALEKINICEAENSVSISEESRNGIECCYKSAIDKLNCSAWKNPVSNPEVLCDDNEISHDAPSRDVPETKKKSSQTTKNSDKSSVQGKNQIVTRSRSRSQVNSKNVQCLGVHVGPTKQTKNDRGPTMETYSLSVKHGNGISCLCNKKKCWCCRQVEVMQSGLISDFVLMKWEFSRRKLLLKVLSGLGKCMDACDKIEESKENLVQSISVLVTRNSFPEPSSMPLTLMLDLIGKDIPEDAFATERAGLLTNICFFTLKGYPCMDLRICDSDMANIQISDIKYWLKLASVLCRELPVLFQKISKLLAVVYVAFASTELPPEHAAICKTVSESQWASYFHHASIGTHVNHQGIIEKEKVQDSLAVKNCCLSDSRIVPEKLHDLEEYVSRFFHGFPWATIIGISLLEDPFTSLLSKILKSPNSLAWLLISRLNSNHQPIVLLRPVLKALSDGNEVTNCSGKGGSENLFGGKEVANCWHCPWGSTVIDEVAPAFKQILEKSYISSSVGPLEDTTDNRRSWWNQRMDLDQKLKKFTIDLEEEWLGSWNHLLLGEWCGNDNPESMYMNRGCFVGEVDRHGDTESLSKREDKEKDLYREPVILILDYDIQMLPWESLPILKKQEVYRMPSIRSVFATLDRNHQCHDQVDTKLVTFPMIDPLNAFYVLNPSGDLVITQTEFEDWFRDQNLEGKVGITPTVDELVLALSSHDLYIYFGHGSGVQYIPGHEIQKLENCAASFLMGCSSGSLSLNGCYAPKGAPLSYLLAGSPVIIANLWDVTDRDIDRFGKAMLDSWLTERSAASSDCIQCKNLVTEKLKALQITETKGNIKKKTSRKKTSKDSDSIIDNDCCNHKPNVGSSVGKAREACKLRYLIGAAPVCYGVPTRIMKKSI